jgi:hypothetical protein
LRDESKFLDKLTPEVFKFLSDTFFVKREWLEGQSDYCFQAETHARNWYKYTHSFANKLIDYAVHGLHPKILFVRRRRCDFERARQPDGDTRELHEPVGVVIRLQRKTPSGSEFYVFETCEFERWNYWRCREQYKLLICFCDHASRYSRLSFDGIELEREDLSLMWAGNTIPVTIFKKNRGIDWYPEDFASFDGEVKLEREEWLSYKEEYNVEAFEKIAKRYELQK